MPAAEWRSHVCSDGRSGRICTAQTASVKRTFKRLQQALATLASFGLRGQENVWVTLSAPAVDGILGRITANAVRVVADVAIPKFGAVPSVPPASDGSHGGLSSGAMAQIMRAGSVDEIARWAGPIANYIQTVRTLEEKWRQGMVIDSALIDKVASEQGKAKTWPWIVGGVILVGFGTFFFWPRKPR
jgi:hypothetical protein